MKILRLISLFVLFYQTLYSQGLTDVEESCPAVPVQFNAPNISNGVYYDWDFCTGDLLGTPTGITLTEFIPGAAAPEGFELVLDDKSTPSNTDDEWFGFITNRSSNNIVRVDFGNDLGNTAPTYTTINATYTNLYELKFRRESGNWYAIAASNIRPPVLLSFGNSLKNVPTAQIVNDPLGVYNFSTPAVPFAFGSTFALDLIEDNGNLIGLFGNSLDFTGFSNTKISIVNFGNSITNPITSANLIQTPNASSIGNGGFRLNGIAVIKDGNKWYGITCGANNITHLDFGTSLYNPNPIITSLNTNLGITTIDAWRVRLVRDGANFMAFLIEGSGNIRRLNFGSTMANLKPIFTNYGNFGLLGSLQQSNRPSFAFNLGINQSNWYFFAINRRVENNDNSRPSAIVRLEFPNICANIPGSNVSTTPQAEFLKFGKNYINLRVRNENYNLIDTYVDSLNITPATIGNFSFETQCLGLNTQFNNLSIGDDENVSSWQWDFGDNNSSNQKNPVHTYTQTGVYQVKLTVNNTSGCTNSITKSIRISQGPIADFQVDSLDCETGKVKFIDLSDLKDSDKALGAKIVNRVWNFGDGTGIIISPNTRTTFFKGASNEYILIPPYNTNGKYPVALTITDDAGCSSTIIKEISFREEDKPIVAFTNSSPCAQVPVQFNSQSILPSEVNDQIVSWNWKFTDLNDVPVFSPSTLPNPQATFLSSGTYIATLTVKGSRGCSASLSKEIEVKSSLTSKFDVSNATGIAPLTVKFTNQTIGASTFKWDFGNDQISTSESPTFTFNSPGVYNVNFQAMNSDGCGTIATRKITVDEQPTANEKFLISKLKVFPNPFDSKINIQLPDNVNFMPYTLIFTDILGKVIYQTDIEQVNFELSTQHIPVGVYLLVFKQNGFTSTRRIVKR